METLPLVLAILASLLIGIAIGAAAAWLVLRERLQAGQALIDRLTTERASLDAAAARAVRDSSGQLLDIAGERFDRDSARREATEQARDAALHRTLSPIVESLSQLERSMARTEHARVQADGSLTAQLRELSLRSADLGRGTNALTAALRAPSTRGRWGEVQLRRIVEAAGMLERVDFTEQHSGRAASGEKGQRPDMVVHLPGARHVVIDAKAPLHAYLDAIDAEQIQQDPAAAAAAHTAHAKALRSHVDALGAKAYWAALGDTPEFVILFVPADGILAAALEADPHLMDHAFGKDVVIASPSTLMALLRTIAHTWRTDSLNRDARAVLDAGRELHQRLGVFTAHLSKLGRSLDSSVGAFNESVGSLRSRVMVTARRFEDVGLVSPPLPDVEELTQRSRTLSEEEIADLASGHSAGGSSSADVAERPRQQGAPRRAEAG